MSNKNNIKTFEERYNACHKTIKNTKLRIWWKKNRSTVLKILLFYIYYPALFLNYLDDKREKALRKKNKFTYEKANLFWDKYFPRFCGKTEEGGFYYFNNGIGIYSKTIDIKDRHFVKYHAHDLLMFLKSEYKIEGYLKTAYDTYDWGAVEVKFTKA